MKVLIVLFSILLGASHVGSSRHGGSTPSEHTPRLKLIVRADRERFSTSEELELSVALRNDGDSPVYIDRRMFWGYGGGLLLQISDAEGKPSESKMLDDAIMPPPLEKDPWVLTRLDEGFFYGTSRIIRIREHFHHAGRYQVRVVYKSWLRKEFVDEQFRNLPALWADAPEIKSDPIWIEVVSN